MRVFFSLVMSMLIVVPGVAADDAMPDTTRVFRMNEVTVTGSRMATDANRLPSPVSVLNEQDLERTNGSTVADALKGLPGVFFKTNGGGGSLQTISSRGMGSEYTLVLVDGQRFTNYQNGQVDFGIFSMADVERIEVAKGGYSALFGADAVGGVVNIITKKTSSDLHASFLAGVGSYGFQHYQAAVSGGTGAFSFKGTYRNEQSSNRFDCYFHDGAISTLTQRGNADYALSVADAAVQMRTGDAITSSLSVRSSIANRGVPAALISATNAGAARLLDKDYFIRYGTEWKRSDVSTLSLHSNVHYFEQHYTDPLLVTGGKPLSSFYVNRSALLTPTYQTSLGEGHSLVAGVELVHAWIVSNELQRKSRTQASAFVSTRHDVSFTAGVPMDVSVFPSLRYDRFSDVTDAVNPKLGVNIGAEGADVLRARASIGSSFRVPTFNDMYWNTGGNPDLRPERSVGWDAGLVSSLRGAVMLECEATYYSIDTKDRIVWMPGANNLWTPRNIARVLSEGVELSLRMRLWDERISVGVVHTISSVEKRQGERDDDATVGKQLPYLPASSSSFDAGVHADNLSLNVRVALTGERFSTEDNDPRYVLPLFAAADATIGYKVIFTQWAAKVKVEVTNVFDTDYQIIALQPMPLRSVRASVEVLY